MRRRGNKFGANRCTCNRGDNHDSGAEARYCNHLDALVRAKEILSFDVHPLIDLIAGVRWRADFKVYPSKDRVEVHEVKGVETEAYRIKAKLFRHCYPDIPLVVIPARSVK